jgi:ATP-binding cassette, subfamily B, multidrug efflux pump
MLSTSFLENEAPPMPSNTMTNQAAPSPSLHLGRWLWQKESKRLGLALLLLPVTGVLQGSIPLLLRWAIEQLQAPTVAPLTFLTSLPFTLSHSASFLVAACLLGVLTLYGLSYYLQMTLAQNAGLHLVQAFREKVLQHVLGLPLPVFQRYGAGFWVTRLGEDVEQLLELVSQTGLSLIADLAVWLACLAVMLWLYWPLALVVYALMALWLGVGVVMTQQSRQANRQLREHSADLNDVLEENILGLPLIKVFGWQAPRLALMERYNQLALKAGLKVVFVDYAFSALVELGCVLSLIVVLSSGAWLLVVQTNVAAIGGLPFVLPHLSLGALVGLFQAVQMAYAPMEEGAQKISTLQAALTSLEKLKEILNLPAQQESNISFSSDTSNTETGIEADIAIEKTESKGLLQVRDLCFRYPSSVLASASNGSSFGAETKQTELKEEPPEEPWVLQHLHFTLQAGERLAVVGPSGTGKSSLLKVLLGFYPANAGTLCLDGHDLNQAQPLAWRKQAMGCILQEDVLLGETLAETITLNYGLPAEAYLNDERLAEAIEAADLKPWLERQPQGLLTPVSVQAETLSTGQKQLLLFARAFYQSPALLILDEATSAMDAETEGRVDAALARLMQGRSVLMVAHRWSTIQRADRLLFMQHGQVQAMGTHEELNATHAGYKAFMAYQLEQAGASVLV